ncbi:MAG: response regulator [Candidatus Buchananbacteria bacterium]|nr:response regulator [Candidatus Buchananbacteria bacterium]
MIDKRKIKVLVVEDDPSISDLYHERLVEDGYQVFAAHNGHDGFVLAQSKKPDLILLDIIMPDVDGYEMLQELKTSQSTKNTPVIIFSNLSQREEIEKGLKLGASDFIIKTSVTPTQMAKKVEEFLNSGKIEK